MALNLSSTANSMKLALCGVLRAGWDRLPPDKATALSEFGSEWASQNISKWHIEFWKRHAIHILWPASLLQLLGTLATVSGGVCASACLACLLLITVGLASLGVAMVIAVASFACTIMAAAAIFPLMIIAATSGAFTSACATGGLAMFIAHAALQRLNIVPQQSSTRIKVSDKQAASSPFGFSADQQGEDLAQADMEMRPLQPSVMPVSDASADLHLLRRRPPTVATAVSPAKDATPRLPSRTDGSRQGQSAASDGGPSRGTADPRAASVEATAHPPRTAQAVEEGPEAVSGYSAAAAAASPPPPAPPSLLDGSAEAAPEATSRPTSSAMLQESSTATLAVSPLSARSTGMESAAASDSVMSRESWVTRSARGPSAEHGEGRRDAAPVAEKLDARLLHARPAVRQRWLKRGGRQTPPPAPSDVSSSGQASVMDIMDQKFMGGV